MRLMRLASRIGRIAGVLTLAIGFAPIVILSLRTHSFWPRSSVRVPLSLVPSVLIGDSILLPFFNARAFTLLDRFLRRTGTQTSRGVFVPLALCSLALSAAINVPLHRAWMKDGNTGFIALVPGAMSTAGSLHLLFATLQMGFAIWFLTFCFWQQSQLNEHEIQYTLDTWKVFLLYSSLAIADFGFWHLVISPGIRFSVTDCVALLPLPVSALAYHLLGRVFHSTRRVAG